MGGNGRQPMIQFCVDCPQYVIKEIEPELPAFCLYWKEGLMLESPTCRNYQKGLIPEEPVFSFTDLSAAASHSDQAGSADGRVTSQLPDQNFSQRGDDSILPSPQAGQPEADLQPGRHLVKIISVRAYLHNFSEYAGLRARLKMKVLDGPDNGKFLFDNVSLPHSQESKGILQRRVLIAYRLGLIPPGTKGTIQVNWKSLEGVICWVDVAHRKFKGRKFNVVDNYQLHSLKSDD